jgi:hypothetical protein
MRVLSLTNVKIELYKGGIFQETIESSTENDGTYTWTQVTPSLADGTDYKVRISSVSDSTIYDESDSAFTIATQPSITVTSPIGGESWAVGSTQQITWEWTGAVGDVKIRYSTNNGSTWKIVAGSTANDGSHDWTVPNFPSSDCLVWVSETDGDASDTSDATFSIIP